MNKRFTAIAMAAIMGLGMTSCGNSSDSSSKESTAAKTDSSEATKEETAPATESAEITGEVQEWGIYSVFVPDGWTLRKGDYFSDTDPNCCSVKKSDFTYFDFKSEKDDVMKNQYNYNKANYTMNQKDVSGKVGDIEWTGFEYGNDLSRGFELYATSNGKNVRVSCCGFTFDSAEAQAVLGSLIIS